MLRKRQSGQALTEFALVLPLLLLLLLGVVEASRIIWAAITVQNAAREAARYAVTGRPYVTSPASSGCFVPQGDPDEDTPWLCDPQDRALAVQEVALRRGRTLAIAEECTGTGGTFFSCADTPGAFGVLVRGQFIDDPIDGVQEQDNHPGEQGLNVTISTYYNIEMIDPIFDFVMGGNSIRLEGEVQMQNEGLDESLGAVPPPPLPTVDIDGSGIPPGTGAAKIESLSGLEVFQNFDLTVRLLKHTASLTYSVHLKNDVTSQDFVICPDLDTVTVKVDATGTGTHDCRVGGNVPEGKYVLYSTVFSQTTPVATYENLITVKAGSIPLIDVVGGDIWAINSDITIQLINHQVPDQPFDLYFDYGGPDEILIASNFNVDSPPIEYNWTVPPVAGKCPPGGSPCRIQSRKVGGSEPYAITDIYFNDPKIVIEQGLTTFAQGETIYFFLTGHTPFTSYDILIGPSAGGVLEARNVTTDASGDYTSRIAVPIPEDNLSWADGNYVIRSHPIGNLAKVIASKNFTVSTPDGPFITVDGGYTWPIDSLIMIKVHKHPANTEHYLEFDNQRVPTSNSSDTFNTGGSGTATVNYRIPISAAVGSPTTVDIESFVNAGSVFQASRQVTVVPVPVIQVLEGSTALPDATITVRITNHSPNSSYRVYYGKTVGDPNSFGKLLFSFITDGDGRAEREYSLKDLPASPPPDFTKPDTCSCYGVPYEMYSESLAGDRLAFTELTIDSADLAITKIDVPTNAQVNSSVPVTVTIENLKPVTISRYFDIDLYLNPSPLVPSFVPGQFNFPGDVKLWENSVAPNGQPGYTFTVTHDFFIGEYGDQELYGYADTSDFIKAENSETNNIDSLLFTVSCNPPPITDNFNSAPLSGQWSTRRYGPDTDADSSATVSGGVLRLNSDGRSTAGTNDDDSSRGHLLLYRNQPVTTTAGLDVSVKVLEAPQGTDSAKGGISIRNSLDPRSMKIEYNLAWNPSASQHRIQSLLRTSYGGSAGNWVASELVNINTQGPVWLRVVREPGSNTFNFYYYLENNSGIAPTATDWTFYTSATVAMDAQVYVGLFNASYTNNTKRLSRFDNFSYTDPSSCPEAVGVPVVEPPPGLTVCTGLLQETSFETAPPQKWFLPPEENVSLFNDPGAPSGSTTLRAPTFEGNFNNPFFHQQFTMPDWVISSTTKFSLNLFREVDALGDDDPNDRFYAVVATAPNVASQITTPTLVAQGIGTTNWQSVNVDLPLLPSVNLEDYTGQPLYVYFYNNSNAQEGCPPFKPTCHDSQFFFDDVQLTSCTTQPPPSPVTSLIKGTVTLHRLGGTNEKIAGVKVWAYSEGGELFETFTVQNGQFNLYNLPSSPSGIEYFIYAEYNIVDASDPTQIETLATNTSVLLKSIHTEATPLTVSLDLYTVTP